MPTVYLSSLNDDDNNINYKFKDSEVREEVADLKSATLGNGTLVLNKSDEKNAYPSKIIGSVVTFTNSNASVSFNKIIAVESEKTYTIEVTNAEEPQSTGSRNTVVVDNDNVVRDVYPITSPAGITTSTEITPSVDGWLILCVDANYVDITIKGPTLQDDIKDLKDAIGAEVIELSESILHRITPAILRSDLSIDFDGPENTTRSVTGLIPLPNTLDNKITHNGSATGNYRAIVFYDSNKEPISGIQNSQNIITNTIPEGAAYFRLASWASTPVDYVAKFNVSASEKVQYILKLLHLNPDCYVHDFEVQNLFKYDHTEISTTTGEAEYNSSSNYSATDFIRIPDNLAEAIIGSYAYTGTGKARVAFYDSDKTFISAGSSTSNRLMSFNVPEGAVFVRFGTHSTTIPPENCRVYAFIAVTESDEEVIDLIRKALV